MITRNPNQKDNHHNTLNISLLRRIYPLLVSFLSFFRQKAQRPSPHHISRKYGVGKSARGLLRIYRNNLNHRLNLSPNALRMLEMWWLAFLVSIFLHAEKILTTTHAVEIAPVPGPRAPRHCEEGASPTKQSQP